MIWMFFRRDNEWIILDSDSEKVLYSTKHLSKPSTVKHLYRGPSTSGDLVATIEYISKDVWLIKNDLQDRGWFFRTPCFHYDSEMYCWTGRTKLTNASGITVVQLTTGSWLYTKVGDMTTVDMDEGMREVVLGTMVAMDWSVRIAISEEVARLELCRQVCEQERNREKDQLRLQGKEN